MIVYVLDRNLTKVGIIDNASSAIFTRRYNDIGDFELYVSASKKIVEILTSNPYIYRENDDTLYIINNIEISSDIDNGAYITVSGSNICEIMNRRVIWRQTSFSGTVENAIRKYINDNAINTIEPNRQIPHLELGAIQNFQETITIQKTGQNLLEAVTELCKSYEYGFRMRLQNNSLIFELYKGERKNVYFSPNFDNLISSKYTFSNQNYKNCALIAGEGEGSFRKRASIYDEFSGIDRFETFIDAKDISTNDGEISDTEYSEMLKTRGFEKLTELKQVESFGGEVETNNTYRLGIDYNLGDIVNIENEYGITATSRIIETIECEDESGYSFIPTFEKWEM